MQALDAIAADRSVRVVVIGGAGPAFCAGHDLREMRADPSRDVMAALFAQCSELMTRIVRLPKPVIARVHGIATAAGCQLVASCDLAVAADRCALRHARREYRPVLLDADGGAVARGRTQGGDGDAAHRRPDRRGAGAGDRAGQPRGAARGELDAAVAALAAQIAGKSPLTLAIGKEAFYRQAEMPLDDAYRYAAEAMTRNMMARDAAEGIDAFLEKRAACWTDR